MFLQNSPRKDNRCSKKWKKHRVAHQNTSLKNRIYIMLKSKKHRVVFLAILPKGCRRIVIRKPQRADFSIGEIGALSFNNGHQSESK